MAVRIIPAQVAMPTATNSPAQRTTKTRVAAYCRVSTDLEEQESSFDSQIRHYTDYILSNPSWELAGIYADEGFSGTGTRKRERFNAMIKACGNGEVDLVITKSISRFARNTLDCLTYIRKLKELNIPILFEKEHINTMDASGEMLITIMASLAQQESQSISQNVRMGHQYRMQQGKPMVTTWFMGYRMSKDKSKLVIVPEQAVVVRRIFREFIEGRSEKAICQGLEADGIKSPSGRDIWQTTTVKSMLQNEKYMGDLLLQKWYIKDFISKKAVKNDGRFPKYYVQNAHDPTVPREVFLQAKGEFLRREHERLVTGKRAVPIHNIPLYEKIVCGECGNTYRRFNAKGGQTSWRCKTRILKGTPCAGRIVKEEDVKQAVVEAFQKVRELKPKLQQMKESVDSDAEAKRIREEITTLTDREDAIRDKISQFAESGVLDNRSTEEEITERLEEMKAELDAIQSRKDNLLRQKAEYDFKACQIEALLTLIGEMEGTYKEKELAALPDPVTETESSRYGNYWPEIKRQMKSYQAPCSRLDDFYERTEVHRHYGLITEFNNEDVQQYIDKIVVEREYLRVVFKAGVSVTVEK